MTERLTDWTVMTTEEADDALCSTKPVIDLDCISIAAWQYPVRGLEQPRTSEP